MSMKKIGETLRQERIRRGLSVDDVNVKIKLSRAIIEAMEEGRMQDLPQPIYVRGFVRSYAAMLGLDHNKLGADLTEICPDPSSGYIPKECVQHGGPAVSSIPGERRQSNAPALLVMLIVLGVISVMAWLAVSSNRTPPQQGVQEEQFEEQAETPPVEPPAQIHEAMEEADTVPGQEENADQSDADMAAEDLEQGQDQDISDQDQVVATDEVQVEEGEDIPPFDEGGMHRLVVMADENCWLGFSIDSQENSQVTLFPGDIHIFEFESALSVKFGNPGGVRLQYDGEPFPFQFTAEQTRTLAFPPVE